MMEYLSSGTSARGSALTSLNSVMRCTILHNKDAHGKKGAIVAIVKDTAPETVAKALKKMPQEDREAVELVSMDLSDSMRSIVRMASLFSQEVLR